MNKRKEAEFKKNVAYEVDFQYLEKNVSFFLELESDKETRKKYSFYESLRFFSDKKIIEPVNASFMKSFNVDCEGVSYSIECDNLIARQVFSVLLNLQNDKKPIHCHWFLWDYDRCNEMPQFEHSFFLAIDYRILATDVELSTSWMDGCDSNILIETTVPTVPDDSMPLWGNMEEDREARIAWYYQKFYQDSNVGQVVAIRDKLRDAADSEPVSDLSDNPNPILDASLAHNRLLSEINKKLTWVLILIGLIVLKILF